MNKYPTLRAFMDACPLTEAPLMAVVRAAFAAADWPEVSHHLFDASSRGNTEWHDYATRFAVQYEATYASVFDLALSCPLDSSQTRMRLLCQAVYTDDYVEAAHFLRNAAREGSGPWFSAAAYYAQAFDIAAKAVSQMPMGSISGSACTTQLGSA